MTNLTFFLSGFLVASLGVGSLTVWVVSQWLRVKNECLRLTTELQSQQRQMLDEQHQHELMAQKFENLAARIFEEKNSHFLNQNLQNMSMMLDPFKERLKDFEKKVEESYTTERSERSSLKGELQQLMQLNLRMSNEAEGLTKALRGDNRAQGTWGEVVLENILEKSGLRKGEEYFLQGIDSALKNEDGTSIRPDAIICLPEHKHLIIDAKVSMTAYDQYMNSEVPEDRERFAKAHTESLRRQVEILASKKYHTADKLISPDFVLLFMPLEPSFALAMKHRPDLQQEAWDKRVALVSPTTLLVTLKMVSALWKTERQEKNALEIAEKGGQLYDKFVNLIADLEMMGKKIEDAHQFHDGVMNKLRDGRGNLVRQVEQLRELGVKASKRLQLLHVEE